MHPDFPTVYNSQVGKTSIFIRVSFSPDGGLQSCHGSIEKIYYDFNSHRRKTTIEFAELVNDFFVVQTEVSVHIHMSASVQSFFPHRRPQIILNYFSVLKDLSPVAVVTGSIAKRGGGSRP